MMSTHQIRVMTVDDHPLMMAGIASVIDAEPDMRVVAQLTDGIQALERYREHRPDVTLMDIRMPEVNGLEALEQIRAVFPNARVVVLTNSAGDMQAYRAFKAGAVGYLFKNLLRTELIDTIRTVHAGGRKVPPEIAQAMAQHMGDDHITPRELDVLRGVAKGRSNKIIAAELFISENTVKNHVKSILSKLSADDRTHAVMIALQRGFLDG